MRKKKEKEVEKPVEVIVLPGRIKRETEGIPCPDCNGYCDETNCTKEEVKKYQTCGRMYACCLAAFVCRLCKKRIITALEAPECRW
jgi:hypothetical protein